MDRESVCDGLRRQLKAEAGGDSSAREEELAQQVQKKKISCEVRVSKLTVPVAFALCLGLAPEG